MSSSAILKPNNSFQISSYLTKPKMAQIAFAVVVLAVAILAFAKIDGVVKMGNAGGTALLIVSGLTLSTLIDSAHRIVELRKEVVQNIMTVYQFQIGNTANYTHIKITLILGNGQQFSYSAEKVNVDLETVRREVTTLCAKHVTSENGHFVSELILQDRWEPSKITSPVKSAQFPFVLV